MFFFFCRKRKETFITSNHYIKWRGISGGHFPFPTYDQLKNSYNSLDSELRYSQIVLQILTSRFYPVNPLEAACTHLPVYPHKKAWHMSFKSIEPSPGSPSLLPHHVAASVLPSSRLRGSPLLQLLLD